MIKLVQGLFYNEEQTKKELCDFIAATDRLSIGPKCEEFEEAFAKWQGRKYCVLFNSGSSANLALMQALLNQGTITPGSKVGFSAITWATNVMPLMQLGLTPIPIDVEMTTLNISSETLRQALDSNPDISVLFITHLLGFCSDLAEIKQLCEERGILLLEDTCEALGTVYQGKKLGNWGEASTFSFFVGHHLSTIEGGAVCTDNPKLARMLKLVRAHGWDRNLSNIEKAEIRQESGVIDDFFANFTFYDLGYNLRPTEITGFLGLQQLQYADEIVERRHHNFLHLNKILSNHTDLFPLDVDHIELISAFATPVVCRAPESVRHYVRLFQDNDVEIRPIVGGSIPEQPFYRKAYGKTDTIKNASLINKQGFYFGNQPEFTKTEITKLCSLLQPAQEPAKL